MTLPDITSRLPKALESSQAVRLQRFLQHANRQLAEPVSITVYGSAAVALYLADESEYEYGYTRDIDIGQMEPDKAIGAAFDAQIVEPPLHFQTYDFTRWLLNPDWSDSVVDVTPLLGTGRLTVRLLHPIDLIITKLERAADQDFEDSILLCERYVDDLAQAQKRVEEAAKYYPMSDRVRGQIEDAFEGIFEQPLDLSELG